jgi:hypothetical protein
MAVGILVDPEAFIRADGHGGTLADFLYICSGIGQDGLLDKVDRVLVEQFKIPNYSITVQAPLASIWILALGPMVRRMVCTISSFCLTSRPTLKKKTENPLAMPSWHCSTSSSGAAPRSR